MKNEVIKKIQSRGYYRINFQPLIFKEKLTTLTACKDIVEKNVIQLRGWDYPHFPRRTGDDTGLEPCGEYYQGWIDWTNHVEFWRMYKTGQFLHYLALREDWMADDLFTSQLTNKIKPMEYLGIIGSVVYQLTEIFEFLSRLTRSGLYDEGVKINISLHNTKDRALWVEDPGRAPLFIEYKTGAEKLVFEKTLYQDGILTHSKDEAFLIIREILDAFGWDNLPIETIKKDQENLLTGKI